MTAPTQPVTVRLADFGGPAAAGVTVTARMSDVDYTGAGVFVANSPVSGDTDANGEVVLNCFPNAVAPAGLGTRGTVTQFTAQLPNSRGLKVLAIVPNQPCNLVNILTDENPAGLTDAEAAIVQAQSAAAGASTSATAASVSAAAASLSVALAAISAAASAASAAAAQAARDVALTAVSIPQAALNITTRTALAAIGAPSALPAILNEAGYEGIFVFDAANHWDGFHTPTPYDANVTVAVDPTTTGGYLVTKVAGGGAWNGASKDTLALTGNYEVWFQRRVLAGSGWMVGVDASPASSQTYTDIDFAVNFAGGSASAYMNGAKDPVTPDWSWSSGLNWFCLKRTGTTMAVYENTTRSIVGATLRHTYSVAGAGTHYFKSVSFTVGDICAVVIDDSTARGTGLVQADPLKAVYVAPTSDTSGRSGAWVRQMEANRIRPEWFGAVGNGTTDDTTAFQRASALLNYWGSGTLVLQPIYGASTPTGRTYKVGRQTLGADAANYSYAPEHIIYLTGFAGRVKIEGNGATLKCASGMKYGSFSPGTGLAYTPPGGGFSDLTYRATPYLGMVHAVSYTGTLEIDNITLDGNEQNLVQGGYWGDVGIQIPATGLLILPGSGRLECRNVISTRQGNDGGTYQATVDNRMDESVIARFIGCEFTYAGRNGFSFTGGRGVVFQSCKFNHTSKGSIQTNPQFGFDMEPDAAMYARDVTFINCEFLNNSNGGYGGGSGRMQEIDFYDCRFSGDPQTGTASASIALFVTKPGHHFHNCRIAGFYQLTATDAVKYEFREQIAEEGWGPQFYNCVFTNNPNEFYTGIAPTFAGGAPTVSGPVLFDNCIWDYQVPGWVATTAYLKDATVRNGTRFYRCTTAGTSAGAGGPTGTGSGIVDNTVVWIYAGDIVGPASQGSGSEPYRVVYRNCTFFTYTTGTLQVAGNFEGFTKANVDAGGNLGFELTPQFIFGRYVRDGVEWFKGSKTFDWPSIAAGASSTTTVTVPGATTTDDRNYRAFMSNGWGGLIAFCEVTAANTVTVTAFNPTGSAIDRASGTLSVVGVR